MKKFPRETFSHKFQMQSSFFLFLCVLCRPAILQSKDLRGAISGEFFNPRDLMKIGNVDKNWMDVGEIHDKLSPNGGDSALFENKKTGEIYFETKEKSWNESEWANRLSLSAEEKEKQLKMIRDKSWNECFYSHMKRKNAVHHFAKILSEMIDIRECPYPPLNVILCMKRPENYLDICLGLLQRGADVNAVDSRERGEDMWFNGKTPLHYAAAHGLPDLIDVLLEHGAQIEANEGRTTPLKCAAAFGQPDAVSLLLKNGARLKSEGMTALELAQFWQKACTVDCSGMLPGYKACIKHLKKAKRKNACIPHIY